MNYMIFAIPALLAAGEVAPPHFQVALQYGALGVLAWVCWTQRQELQDLRKSYSVTLDKLCDRWDGWERVRHADSEKLDDTLRLMTAQCEKTRGAIKDLEVD